METPREIFRDFTNTILCLGEVVLLGLREACMAVDDNIQELPDE